MEIKRDNYVYDNVIEVEDLDKVSSRKFLAGVFSWMFVALAISAFCSYEFANNLSLLSLVFDLQTGARTGFGLIVMFSPFAFILAMSFGLNKMSYPVLAVLFIAFATCMGISLSSVLLVYTGGSVLGVFITAAVIFATMAIAGYTTQQDLTSFGSLLIVALWGLIIASLVNWFLHSEQLSYIISYIGVAIFVGLTAYDVQKLKQIGAELEHGQTETKKYALIGALTLYLDFVNLFLYLLRIFGRRR
ncbi:Bax inhibitor-1/YccA family protein [Mucilaginibacter sp. HMF5004]|uniref:Bax inhibitor-1/YccA family protein n=1 Tax=Mucilaginibacter rivuli TaxID=2857527 RepID=UPI001C5F8256|nr:Bax inhibitor-1/YccA family protein [Mucilaginibacter rivuli]MBW4891772.1 Bax inhibitor-1/YccA family protein [Mucilaginibacter rivuli]